MGIARSSIFAAGWLAYASPALAQQAPEPPPPAPDPNWAPPIPQDPPPAPPAPPPPQPGTTTTTTTTTVTPPGAQPQPQQPQQPQPPQPPQPYQPQQPQPEPEQQGTKFELYGFTMLDAGYDFGQIGDPNWQDVLRPTKLPAFRDQFGKSDRTFMGVRQSRFGVKTTTPTYRGDLKTQFEWELFGVGVDEGQTTIRLRHAYGDWWQIRAGQTWSPFMDIDVFPNSIEYWGPPGMAFFRNVQLAWMPIQGDSRVTIALERPGASVDAGVYADRIELESVVPRFPLPDLSAEARLGGTWGYIEAAGILRRIEWDDLADPAEAPSFNLSGEATGWGLSLSSNLKAGPALLRLQAVYGEGIQNYMNDAPADIGARRTNDPSRPLDGEALPLLGLVGFVDLEWSKQFTSSLGYSMIWIDNSSEQAPDAFHIGHYALGNLLFHPTEKMMIGGEFQFGRRENFSDGWEVNDYRLQLSVKYNFETVIGGE